MTETLLSVKNIVLLAILALGAWALSPPADGKKTATLGTSTAKDAPPAKFVIRFHPGPLYLPGVVPVLSETPGEIRTPAPKLGEHTDEVLRQIGFSDHDIEGLRARKIV